MAYTKIATCCYCGTRAALVLQGQERHELACGSCGAPLHDLKKLRRDAVDKAAHRPLREGKKARRRAVHSPLDQLEARLRGKTLRGKKKRKKGLWAEAFDLIEDIFD